jgi:hypothetical protein
MIDDHCHCHRCCFEFVVVVELVAVVVIGKAIVKVDLACLLVGMDYLLMESRMIRVNL